GMIGQQPIAGLAVAEGLLGGALGGDVAHDAAGAIDAAPLVDDLGPAVADPANLPVRPDDAIFDGVKGLQACERVVEQVMHEFAVFGMNPPLAAADVAVKLTGRHAPDALERGIHIKQTLGREVNEPEAFVDRTGQLAETLFAIADVS